MRLLLAFARAHPRRSLITLLCLLLAGVAEGVGISSVLPLLELATEDGTGAEERSGLARAVAGGLARVGLEPHLELLLGLVVAGMTGKAVLMLLANRQVGYTVARVATELRLSLIRALLGARWEYYARQPVGTLANAFATEAERASQAFLHGTLVVAAGMQVLVYAGVALAVSWPATLGALGLGVFTSWALAWLVRAARRSGSRQTELLKRTLNRLSDTLQGVKPLRAMDREALVGPLLEREARDLDRALRGEVLSKEGLRALQEPLVVGALAAGLYLALGRWGLPVSSLLMLGFLFARTLGAVNRGQKQYQSMAAKESAYESLRTTIERAEAAREETTGRQEPTLRRGIVFDDVSVAYEGEPVLESVHLEIPAGGITALVGPSGAGKSTVADLLVGLVRPTRGAVRVDGVPLERLDLRRWRRGVGYVPQEAFLLHDTIFANVALGDPGVDDARVWRALERAGAAEFVARLPEGVQAVVGERGSLLSGGQRQRIAIARALVHEPRLLVLDEATTALDPETEAGVCAALRELQGDVTLLVISHQPALVALAERVYRIGGGKAERVRA